MSDYTSHYKNLDKTVFPSEWIVRSFLGKYKNYTSPSRNNKDSELKREVYQGKKILDIGYGDGRNLSFFNALSMDVYGVEPFEQVVSHSSKLFPWANLSIGQNCNLPYSELFFDYVIASHSIYYLNKDQTLFDSLKEVYRVLKPKGNLFFTVPTSKNHTLKGAKKFAQTNQWILEDAFYKVRKGQIIETVESETNLIILLSKLGFDNISIAKWHVDWWGTIEDSFLVYCEKK